MVLNAHQRLADCRNHLDEGDFQAALHSVSQLQDRLGHLAHAQTRLGALADAHLVRCADLEVGMRTQGGAKVTAIDPCPCSLEHCEKRLVTFDDGHQLHIEPEWEIVVDVGELGDGISG